MSGVGGENNPLITLEKSMAAESTAKEKVQLVLRTDLVNRIHELKGRERGSTISGITEQALDRYFAQLDRNQHKGSSNRQLASAS